MDDSHEPTHFYKPETSSVIKVDFHSHSIASPDGSITGKQYQHTLDQGILDCIAITDHDRIDFAQTVHKQLGPAIIIGEEITTTKGELIGLFLQEKIEPGQTPFATAEAIKAQHGLVYVPHPFETIRKGISMDELKRITRLVDIIEIYNGRAILQSHSRTAIAWAEEYHVAQAAASDAHGQRGLGYTYTTVETMPSINTTLALLSNAHVTNHRPPVSTLLYPKLNRAKKKFLWNSM